MCKLFEMLNEYITSSISIPPITTNWCWPCLFPLPRHYQLLTSLLLLWLLKVRKYRTNLQYTFTMLYYISIIALVVCIMPHPCINLNILNELHFTLILFRVFIEAIFLSVDLCEYYSSESLEMRVNAEVFCCFQLYYLWKQFLLENFIFCIRFYTEFIHACSKE